MLNKSLLLLSFFLLVFFTGISQQTATYSNSFQNIGTIVNSFIGNDGNLVSCSNSTSGNYFIVVKTNSNDGSVIYEKVFDFPSNIFVINSALAANGDYLFVAKNSLNNYAVNELIVIRMTSSGTISWNKHFSSQYFFPEFIKETPTGEILVGGNCWQGYLQNAVAVKITSTGTLSWVNIYENYEGRFYDVEFIGSDYLFVGEAQYNYNFTSVTAGLLCKIASNGVLLNMQEIETVIGAGNYTSFRRIVKRDDGGFLIAGEGIGIIGGYDAIVAAYNSSGNYEWVRAYGGPHIEHVFDLNKVGPNEYILGGLSKSVDFVTDMGWYFKISSSGYVIWSKVVGADMGVDEVKSVSVLPNNYLMLSVKNGTNSVPYQIIKTNDFGENSCGMENYSPINQLFTLNSSNISAPTVNWSYAVSSPPVILSTSLYSLTQNCQMSMLEPITYHKIIMGPGADRITDIKETLDGGVIAAGSSANGFHGGSDIFATRLDNNGDTLWTKFYGTALNDDTEGVLVKLDGGFLIMNSTQNTLINIDPNGQVINSKKFDGQVGASKMCLTSDNNILIAVGLGKILKLDANLNLIWQKQYDSWFDINDITESSNGDYLVCGSVNWGTDRIGVMRLTNTGVVLWYKDYYDPGSGDERGQSLVETDQGDIIVCGETQYGFGAINDIRIVLLKISGNGVFISGKMMSNFAKGRAIERNGNGIYLVGFQIMSNENSAILVKINTSLNIEWSKSYGTFNPAPYEDDLFALEPMHDGSLVMGGETLNFGNGTKEFLLMKVDASGNLFGCHEETTIINLSDIIFTAVPDFASNISSSLNSITTTLEGNLSVPLLNLNLDVNSIITNNLCNGSANGTAEAQVIGGIAPYTYSWSQGGTNDLINNLLEGQYIVTVTDETGCQGIDTVNLIDPDLMTSAINTTNPLCAGTNTGVAQVIMAGGIAPYTYQWNSGQITPQAINMLEGNYVVNVLDANNCLHSTLATLVDPDPVGVSFASIPSTCGAADGSIIASGVGGNNNFTYSWDNLVNDSLNANILSGVYEVTVVDGNGCLHTEPYTLGYQVLPVEICVITVDSLNRNVVVWGKPISSNIEGFFIYRNIGGAYSQIGYQPYDSISQFVDLSFGVDPTITAYRYKISVLDTCGFESILSNYHQTLHLTTNQGISGEVNLIWSDYEGFVYTQYNILRDSTGLGDWETLATIPNTNFTYTDLSPPNTINLDYLIEVVLPEPCTAEKAIGYNSSRSNRAKSLFSGGESQDADVDELILSQIKLYPNPNQGLFTISTLTDKWNYEIFDVNGKLIMQKSVSSMESTIDAKHLNPGVYLVKITVGESQKTERFIKQ